jgi:hypothetical protein
MFWIANEGTGKVSIVDGAGKASTGKPASDAIDLGEGITGITTNDSMEMQVTNDVTCGPASLIFGSVHGQLIGVNTDVNPTGGSVLVDNSKTGAIYTGVATVHGQVCGKGATGTGSGNGSGGQTSCQNTGPILLLAADFHNGRVNVFDEGFHMLATPAFTVTDLPAGFAPFNVMVWNNIVYVTYAQQDADKKDSVAGPGLGFVAAFDASGKLMWTAKGNELNAPWGMALAGNMTLFPGALLVGNFGDGHLTAIDLMTGSVLGQVMDVRGGALAIEGLWGISLGTGVQNATAGALYFAAGPDDEMHGMFGLLTLATSPPQM